MKRDCQLPHDKATPATVDQKTIYGPWAYLCADHSATHGQGPATILANLDPEA